MSRIQVKLCSNTAKRYWLAMAVDVEGVGNEIGTLPINARSDPLTTHFTLFAFPTTSTNFHLPPKCHSPPQSIIQCVHFSEGMFFIFFIIINVCVPSLLRVDRCVVPDIVVETPLLNFQRCFLDYPYEQKVRLTNPGTVATCYGVLDKVRHVFALNWKCMSTALLSAYGPAHTHKQRVKKKSWNMFRLGNTSPPPSSLHKMLF